MPLSIDFSKVFADVCNSNPDILIDLARSSFLKGSCTELGRCGKAARYYLASVGVDGEFVNPVPVGFACEAGPAQGDRGLLKCTTVEEVTNVTNGVFTTVCLLAYVYPQCANVQCTIIYVLYLKLIKRSALISDF